MNWAWYTDGESKHLGYWMVRQSSVLSFLSNYGWGKSYLLHSIPTHDNATEWRAAVIKCFFVANGAPLNGAGVNYLCLNVVQSFVYVRGLHNYLRICIWEWKLQYIFTFNMERSTCRWLGIWSDLPTVMSEAQQVQFNSFVPSMTSPS